MDKQRIALAIMGTAVDFLAAKHGVAPSVIVEALEQRNEKIVGQFATLAADAIAAIAAPKAS